MTLEFSLKNPLAVTAEQITSKTLSLIRRQKILYWLVPVWVVFVTIVSISLSYLSLGIPFSEGILSICAPLIAASLVSVFVARNNDIYFMGGAVYFCILAIFDNHVGKTGTLLYWGIVALAASVVFQALKVMVDDELSSYQYLSENTPIASEWVVTACKNSIECDSYRLSVLESVRGLTKAEAEMLRFESERIVEELRLKGKSNFSLLSEHSPIFGEEQIVT